MLLGFEKFFPLDELKEIMVKLKQIFIFFIFVFTVNHAIADSLPALPKLETENHQEVDMAAAEGGNEGGEQSLWQWFKGLFGFGEDERLDKQPDEKPQKQVIAQQKAPKRTIDDSIADITSTDVTPFSQATEDKLREGNNREELNQISAADLPQDHEEGPVSSFEYNELSEYNGSSPDTVPLSIAEPEQRALGEGGIRPVKKFSEKETLSFGYDNFSGEDADFNVQDANDVFAEFAEDASAIGTGASTGAITNMETPGNLDSKPIQSQPSPELLRLERQEIESIKQTGGSEMQTVGSKMQAGGSEMQADDLEIPDFDRLLSGDELAISTNTENPTSKLAADAEKVGDSAENALPTLESLPDIPTAKEMSADSLTSGSRPSLVDQISENGMNFSGTNQKVGDKESPSLYTDEELSEDDKDGAPVLNEPKMRADNVSRFREQIKQNLVEKRPLPQIAVQQLELANRDDDSMLSQKIDNKQLKFVNDETKVLTLPNDDVVLGSLTEEAKIEAMDLRSYLIIFWENYERVLNEDRRESIELFVDNYDDNFNTERFLYFDENDYDGLNMAISAIKHNNQSNLKTLLDHYTILQLAGMGGNNLLHMAAYEGNYQASKLLLMRGIDMRATNDRGENAMIIAKRYDHQHIVYLLRKAGLR